MRVGPSSPVIAPEHEQHPPFLDSSERNNERWPGGRFSRLARDCRRPDLASDDLGHPCRRLRTSLFTADRSELVRGDAALRLEQDVRGFLDGWDALRDENDALIREALSGDNDQPTSISLGGLAGLSRCADTSLEEVPEVARPENLEPGMQEETAEGLSRFLSTTTNQDRRTDNRARCDRSHSIDHIHR
jgi:hypothetical protein